MVRVQLKSDYWTDWFALCAKLKPSWCNGTPRPIRKSVTNMDILRSVSHILRRHHYYNRWPISTKEEMLLWVRLWLQSTSIVGICSLWVRHFNNRFRRCRWSGQITQIKESIVNTRDAYVLTRFGTAATTGAVTQDRRANRLHTQKSITRQTGSPTPKDQFDAPCVDCE